MEKVKGLLKSKTVWAGAILIVASIVDVATGGQITMENVVVFFGGFGVIGLRDALKKIQENL